MFVDRAGGRIHDPLARVPVPAGGAWDGIAPGGRREGPGGCAGARRSPGKGCAPGKGRWAGEAVSPCQNGRDERDSAAVRWVADNCNCEGFSLRSCRFNYGVKDDELKEIKLSLIEDKSNFNVVSVQDDKVTYYNYNIWYQMYKENGYGSNFSPEILNKYQQDYEYNTKEKEVFEKITTLLNQYELKNIKYYIPTKNNYYLFNTSDNSLYKYDIRTNKINKYLELNTCDITYLYEK